MVGRTIPLAHSKFWRQWLVLTVLVSLATTSWSFCLPSIVRQLQKTDTDSNLINLFNQVSSSTQSSAVSSASASQSIQHEHEELSQHVCQKCRATFASRNALFRHVRSASCDTPNDHDVSASTKKRYTAIIQVAYHAIVSTPCYTKDGALSPQEVGEIVQQAVDASLDVKTLSSTTNGNKSRVQSRTQTSVANQRQPALQTEEGVSSTGDIISLTLLVDEEEQYRMMGNQDSWGERIQHEIEEILASKYNPQQQGQIRLLSIKALSSTETSFHAEQECTQRIFHYLLPLSWLPDGEALEQWWIDNESLEASQRRPLPSNSLKVLRAILKQATSTSIPNRKVRRKQRNNRRDDEPSSYRAGSVASTGRRSRIFGNQIPQCWHNFANKDLFGQASPNQDAVWRIVDAACIAGFTRIYDKSDKHETVVAILEFRGDDFLQGQIRSMVATIVAIAHGWVPSDTFELATKPDSFLHLPIAPGGRLYSTTPRFHFNEGTETGLNSNSTSVMNWIQQHLLLERQSQRQIEADWMNHLKTIAAPLMKRELVDLQKASESNPIDQVGDHTVIKVATPEMYSPTLKLLRQIVANGEWPQTSVARASVIRPDGAYQNTTRSVGGSFTVFNPVFLDTIVDEGNTPPLGNIKFPELTEAIFELESQLANQGLLPRAAVDGTFLNSELSKNCKDIPKRPPSLCCAVNCNAQFTPHVDSGRGQGQSVSMIVGLGDYSGGRLFVEGISHDIQYRPLEFDGWSSRHWTGPYFGERFSLVWFSPEMNK